MLGSRYKYNGMPLINLSPLQLVTRNIVEDKVKKNIYTFEKIPCCICEQSDFQELATRDRYGLHYPVVICKHCGMAQANPRMTQASYNEFYKKEYRKLYGGEEKPSEAFFQNQYSIGGSIFTFIEGAGAEGLLPKPVHKMHVLEVGCGAGGILKFFRDKGCTVQGIDLGLEYLEYGKKNFGLDLHESSIKDFSPEKKFDLIIYNHVLEHILDPNEELKYVHGLLAPDGILFVGVPGIININDEFYHNDFLLYLQNAHTYHFSLQTLNNLLTKNDFELIGATNHILSLFKKADTASQKKIINDFELEIEFLTKLEKLRELKEQM